MKVRIIHLPAYVSAFSVIIVAALLWSFHSTYLRQDQIYKESNETLFHLKTDQQKIERLLNNDDIAAVQSLLPTLSESALIKRLLLIDGDYQVMAASGGKLLQTDVSQLEPQIQNRLRSFELQQDSFIEVNSTSELIYQLSLPGAQTGYLYVQLDLEHLQATDVKSLIINLLIFFCSSALAATIFYYVTRHIMQKRVARLVSVLVEYTDGKREKRFAARDNSEFQRLELLLNGTFDLLEHEQEVLAQEKEFSKQILDSMTDGVVTVDQSGKIIMVNQQLISMFGYHYEQELLGANVLTLIPGEFQERHINSLKRANLDHRFSKGMLRKVKDVSGLTKDGLYIPVSLTVIKKLSQQEIYYSAFIQDMSEKFQYQESLDQLAYFDALTSLNNTLGFKRQIANMRKPINLCLLELNELHTVNETFGYEIGDQYLVDFALLLKQLPLEDLVLAKSTGARFIVATTADKELLQNALEQLLQRSILVVDVAKRIEFYCALAFAEGISQLDEQLRYCRIAIRKALEQAESKFVEIDVKWIEHQFYRSKLQHKLSLALNNHELYFDYQPKFSTKERKVVSAEALIRWRSNGQNVSPGEFIPIAEKSHLMPTMDKYVISSVCRFIRFGLDHSLHLVPISVNLSSRYLFSDSTIAYIFEKIGEYKIPANLIEVEVTEYELIQDFDSTAKNMERLEKAGIRVAIDDYGIGHSNLETVSSLPIQHLKIDQSFIKRALSSSKSKAILENIIDLAQSLNIEITAEGVETQEQFEYVKSLGCDYVQGYLLSKPLTQRDFESLLNSPANSLYPESGPYT